MTEIQKSASVRDAIEYTLQDVASMYARSTLMTD